MSWHSVRLVAAVAVVAGVDAVAGAVGVCRQDSMLGFYARILCQDSMLISISKARILCQIPRWQVRLQYTGISGFYVKIVQN